jgi:hypothetical protein
VTCIIKTFDISIFSFIIGIHVIRCLTWILTTQYRVKSGWNSGKWCEMVQNKSIVFLRENIEALQWVLLLMLELVITILTTTIITQASITQSYYTLKIVIMILFKHLPFNMENICSFWSWFLCLVCSLLMLNAVISFTVINL